MPPSPPPPQQRQTVPKIDKLAGIEHYCCEDFQGIGGSIKNEISAFRVTELVDDTRLEIVNEFSGSYRYPLFLLEKAGIDSNHALFEIERERHLHLRILGIKDAKATTSQYASSERVWNNPPKEIHTRHTLLKLKGFTKKPISKEILKGNEFSITIQNPIYEEMSDFDEQILKIGNFYGLQRFGSERLVTHLVGREIVRQDFAKAVDLLISYTTEYDTETSRYIRTLCSDPSKYKQALKEMPRGMDIERQLVSGLLAGKGPILALRTVPIQIRRLFVQAYQAFIFNRCLSRAIAQGYNIANPEKDDLCFELEDELIFGRIKKYDSTIQHSLRWVPAIRLAGYTFQPGKGRFESITKEILKEDEVTAKDFYIKEMQELSQQGGFRQAPLCCREFTWKKNPLVVSFKLPKGSYATTLLRELIKPEDPIKAGF